MVGITPSSRKSLNQTSWLPRLKGMGGGSAAPLPENMARPMRVSATREEAGAPSMPTKPTRSPPRTSSEASANKSKSARARLEVAPDLKFMLAEASRQNQTVWAASHSRSRTKMCCDLADWRQSMAEDESWLA